MRPDETSEDVPAINHDEGERPAAVAGVEDVVAATPEDARVASLIAREEADPRALANAMAEQEPADAADVLEDLGGEDAADVLEHMEEQAAAEALAEMQRPLGVGMLQDLLADDLRYAALLLELMSPDDAADLLQAIDPEQRHRLLEAMQPQPAQLLAQLMAYDRESAGGMMNTDCLKLREYMNVAEAIEYIRAHEVHEETHYALVVNDVQKLVGIVGLRKLLLARSHERVTDLMEMSVDAIRAELDREQVARSFDRYDYSVLPVVDDHDRLLGVVTVDDVIDIIREEQTEDTQRTVGAGKHEAVYSSIADKMRGRFPWMVASTGLTCLSAGIILASQGLISQIPIISFIMAVIAPLSGNAGQQALAVTLRGIVLDEVRQERIWPLILREIAVGLCIGTGVGVLLLGALYGYLSWSGAADWHLALVAFASAPAAIMIGTLSGSGIPLLMRRFGFDPAHASAIFLIMITDGVSFMTTIGLASVWVGVAT